MSAESLLLSAPRHVPPLHPEFRPVSVGNGRFREAVRESGKGVPLVLCVERNNGARSQYRTEIFPPSSPHWGESLLYAERLVKTLLWQKGGWKLQVGGPPELAASLKGTYGPAGARAFDAEMMARIYERPFVVEGSDPDKVPAANEPAVRKGGHLDGCRIGFDAGGSDRKVAAVIDGKPVWSEEVIWNPKEQKDPQYHVDGILSSMKAAAAHMPRVDAIGVSSAGVYVDNRTMVASLFKEVPPDLFESRIKNVYTDAARQFGNVPIEVANDGDVTALAGALSIGEGAVLGIAMGTSQAAGYVSPAGTLTDWLNELAFVPVDYDPAAPVDDWSRDSGTGSQYFSQQATNRLAARSGLAVEGKTPAEKLKSTQQLLASGDDRAARIFETVGTYLGYAVAGYSDLYEFRHMLVLGRVTSGAGGDILMKAARTVLADEFPRVAERIRFHLPQEESARRVGQAIAAASLPEIRR